MIGARHHRDTWVGLDRSLNAAISAQNRRQHKFVAFLDFFVRKCLWVCAEVKLFEVHDTRLSKGIILTHSKS